MKTNTIITEAADAIEAHMRLSNTHTLTTQEIAELLPGTTSAEVTRVIRYLLAKRAIKHSLGRFIYNYERVQQQRSLVHQYVDSVARAASLCMSLPPVDWVEVFAGDLDQNEQTVFRSLAAPIVAQWESDYYNREKAGHFRNLQKGSLFA